MTADRNPMGCCQPMRFDSSNLHFFRIGQCLTSQGSSDRPSGNSQYDSCRIHHLNFANCRGSFFAKYWRCIMARLTLEDLRADPLVKPDFDILKKSAYLKMNLGGLFVRCQIFVMMNILILKLRVCSLYIQLVIFHVFTNLIQKQLKKFSNNERYVLYQLSCCYACSCSCC